jgi:predicted small metal-binding protein
MKTIACGEVVPGCRHHFSAETEDELLAQVGKHAVEEHGLEVTPELVDAVRAKIVDDGDPESM